ncbi:hypothetical protein C8R44DRAFT_769500 [Mycena epipterygia]|nr:hypothetical protein C8R44DRAFT_769500 [Mycena epipterygia]
MSEKRLARSGGQLRDAAQAEEQKLYENYLQSNPLLVTSTLFPALRMYHQPDGGARIRVDNDSGYVDLLVLARTVLGHLIGVKLAQNYLVAIMGLIGSTPAAKAALVSKLGEDRDITTADIVDFLKNETPAIIFKSLRSEEGANAVVWGLVVKGEEDGAEANEVFLSLELTDALRLNPPTSITQAESDLQRQRQTLLWSIALLHELVHAISKHFFSALTITPKITGMVTDNKGNSEAGCTFEKKYLEFHLEAVWTNEDICLPDRMWKISHLLAAHLGSPVLVLDSLDIQRLQNSFVRQAFWCPLPEHLEKWTFNSNSFTRCRVGVLRPITDSEEEETVSKPRGSMVISSMCPRV